MKKSKQQIALEQHFAVGNIIFSGYWREHDEVLAFDWNNGSWNVTVQRVKMINGEWVKVERPRCHSTMPEKGFRGDKVVLPLAA